MGVWLGGGLKVMAAPSDPCVNYVMSSLDVSFRVLWA